MHIITVPSTHESTTKLSLLVKSFKTTGNAVDDADELFFDRKHEERKKDAISHKQGLACFNFPVQIDRNKQH